MTRGRNAQSSRQLMIQQMLQASGLKGLSPREIAERLEDRGLTVTLRTIHRDIEGLQAAGIPLTASGSKTDEGGTRWKIDISATAARSGQSAILKIQPHQLAGLYLAKEQFKLLSKNSMFRDLDQFFEQVSDLIGAKNRALLDEYKKDFSILQNDSMPTNIDSDVVEVIRSAIAEAQCFEVIYESAHSSSKTLRTLGPIHLYLADGGLYLIAEDLADGKTKTFAVPRMTSAKLLDKEYLANKDIGERYFDESFGAWRGEQSQEVIVEISNAQAAFVRERLWHSSQKIEDIAQGAVRLHMNVGITPKLVNWILNFGDNAVVVAPLELKQKVGDVADKVRKKYFKAG